MTNSTLSANRTGDGNPGEGGSSAGSGAGIYNRLGTVTLTNSTVSGNQNGVGPEGGGRGAGIFSNSGGLSLTGCTVSNNAAGGGANSQGGGIFVSDEFALGTSASARNVIVAGNSAPGGQGPDVYGDLTLDGYNLIRNTSGANLAENQNPGT